MKTGMEGRTEERRVEEVRGFVRGLGQYKHLEHVSSVLEGKGHCNLDHECPECVEERLRIEPRRLSRHLAAMILEPHPAHRLECGSF